jgi:hypothetical protein
MQEEIQILGRHLSGAFEEDNCFGMKNWNGL